MSVEVQTATRGLLQQGTPPRSEQSESQGRQGQAKAREGSFLGLCHRGQLRGPKFWGPLWCTGRQAQQGSPAVLAWWGPVSRSPWTSWWSPSGAKEGEGYLHSSLHSLALLPVGPPRLGLVPGTAVTGWRTPGSCVHGVSGEATPLRGLHASGLRTGTDGLGCLGAGGQGQGHRPGPQCAGWPDQATGCFLSMVGHFCAV